MDEIRIAMLSGHYPADVMADIERSALAAPPQDRAEFVANMLDTLPRSGADTDEPEGARFAVASETLLDLMAKILRGES